MTENEIRRANLDQLLTDAAKFVGKFPSQLSQPNSADPTTRARELDQLQQLARAAASALEMVADRCGDFADALLEPEPPPEPPGRR